MQSEAQAQAPVVVLLTKTPATAPAAHTASFFECEPAVACEASTMQMMQRISISDVKLLLQEVLASHSAM